MSEVDSNSLVLGLDPGLNTTGYGLLRILDGPGTNRLELVEAGIVTSRRKDPLGSRLASLHEGIGEVFAAWKPGVCAIEKLYTHYERPETAIMMGHARGVICLAAAQADVPVRDYAATQVKKVLTGNGRAPKSQVQWAIARQLGLPAVPEPADVADALAIAACHFFLNFRTTSLT